jgi:hypothetical protein
MIIKLKITTDRKNKKRKKKIVLWIQKHKDFDQDICQVLSFFKTNVKISQAWRFRRYYKITSENPAILLSLFSTIQELIPEVYEDKLSLINCENSPFP